MTFWLKTPNNIYKNWLNSHIDKTMFKVSRNKNRHVAVKVAHPGIDMYYNKICIFYLSYVSLFKEIELYQILFE